MSAPKLSTSPSNPTGKFQRAFLWIRSFFSEKKVLAWGVVSVLIGLLLIFKATNMEQGHREPANAPDIWAQFIGHLGIAFLLLGVVTIILEFRNWRAYFEDRLQNIILKKDFLRGLGTDQQKVLLKEVLLAIYKVDNLDRESFLDFFTKKIQDFIGAPFRENTTMIITLDRRDTDGALIAEVDQTYTCKKIPAEGAVLQKNIKYFVDRTDLSEDIQQYKIILRLPEETPKTFSVPDIFEPFRKDANRIVLDSAILRATESDSTKAAKLVKVQETFKKLVTTNPDGYGFKLSLQPFQTLECLDVQVSVTLCLKPERFLGWEMTHLSQGLRTIIHYPKDKFEILLEDFGMDEKRLAIIDDPGRYSLNYDSWLLPTTGFAFRLMKSTKATSAEAIDANGKNRFGLGPDVKSKLESSPVVSIASSHKTVLIGADPDIATLSPSVDDKETRWEEFDDLIINQSYHRFRRAKP